MTLCYLNLSLLVLISTSMIFSMEENYILNAMLPQRHNHEQIVTDIFGNNKELYRCHDESGIPLVDQGGSQYTYVTPGGVECNTVQNFPTIRNSEHMIYRYPGILLIGNGVVNRPKGLKNGFNWKLEAIRHVKILQDLFKKGISVQCWQTVCYGFWALSSTLYGLQSGSHDAVELRGQLFISDSEAAVILEKLKLIIVSAPLLSADKMLKKQVNPLIEAGLMTASTVPTIVNTGEVLLCNGAFRPTTFLYPPLMNYFKSTIASYLSYYGIGYKTSIDEKRGEGLQLLYDLSKEKRNINSTMVVTWQKKDDIVDTVQPYDLSVLKSVFTDIVGIGSPYDDHLHDDIRQRRVMNWVRRELNMPHYDVPELLKAGKRHFDEIMPYHFDQDWVGLKEFTEDPKHYIL